MRWVVVCGALAACGRIDFDPRSQPGFANLSARAFVHDATDGVAIVGFIVIGAATRVVIVARGPSLVTGAVAQPLQDPMLELHHTATPDELVATNDDWRSTEPDAIVATGHAPSDDREAALIATLPGRNGFTAIARGKGGTTGVVAVEVYQLDTPGDGALGNVSLRGFVDATHPLQGTIVLPTNERVVLRGLGPSLTSRGVVGALQDPTLQLADESGAQIATNDNWRDAQQAAELGVQAPADDREAAIVVDDLPSGAYTGGAAGVGGTAGIALVEAYSGPARLVDR